MRVSDKPMHVEAYGKNPNEAHLNAQTCQSLKYGFARHYMFPHFGHQTPPSHITDENQFKVREQVKFKLNGWKPLKKYMIQLKLLME